jgi:predicted permease
MLARLVAYLRGIAARRRVAAESNEELRFHLEQQIEAHLARGVAPREARRLALRDLGGVTQTTEAVRDVRALTLDTFARDVRHAMRALRRSPVFSATAILTLAIGIGGTTAIFSIVHAVLLRPLPYRDPARLVRIWEAHAPDGHTHALVSAADFNDWRARSTTFDDLALFGVETDPVVLGVGDASLQARQAAVTLNLFGVLGIQPALGRAFHPPAGGRQTPTDGREVIVSHALWQRAFGGDPAVIGRAIRVEGAPGSVVVGVMPAGFTFPDETDVWMPMDAAHAAVVGGRGDRLYGAIGRLRPDVDAAAARSDLQSIATALARDHPATNAAWTITLLPLHDAFVGGHRLTLVTLMAAVAFVMLVGCANVSNLLLARGVARRGELAVRAALGAGRWSLVRLLLAEAVVLAGAGGIVGGVLAGLLLPTLIRLAGAHVPRLADAHVNIAALGCAAAAAMLSALVTGIVPALRHSRADVRTAITPDAERTTRSGRDLRLQRAIVAAELAACLVLLVGALLFGRTLVRLEAVDLGFDPAHVISIDARMPLYRSLAPDRWQRLASDIRAALDRVRSTPGVEAASATSDLPLAGMPVTTEVALAGDVRARAATYHRVSPGYFRTLGMTLVRGRDFTGADISDLARLPDPRAAVPRTGAVIVNEATARRFWPDGDAIGQILSTTFDARPIGRREVVGIVRDARSDTLRGDPPVEIYVPYLEDPSFATTLLVRTTRPIEAIVPILRRALHDVSPDLSTANVRMLDDVVGDATRSSRFSAVVIATFAGTALLLSALGVFGVFAFGIATRVREIGIRMALGATRTDITRLFLAQAVGPIAAGVTIGSAGAFALGRSVRALLYGVSPHDTLSYLSAVCLLVIVALAASYLPVRRVLRAGPMRALRN